MIGIFDSGSGGLSVLRALRACAPDADVVYFGDLKNAPYGNKSREELGVLTVLGIQKLIEEGATEIVSACNSVSVSIVLPMFDILDLPRANLIEMVGPTVCSFKGVPAKVLVVATTATVESGIYQEGLRMIGVYADGVAVSDLVARIEAGAEEEELYRIMRTALAGQIDLTHTHVVLGCTHFPLVRTSFARALQDAGSVAQIVDPAYAVAKRVCARYATNGEGRTRFLISKESGVFKRHADTDAYGRVRTFEVV